MRNSAYKNIGKSLNMEHSKLCVSRQERERIARRPGVVWRPAEAGRPQEAPGNAVQGFLREQPTPPPDEDYEWTARGGLAGKPALKKFSIFAGTKYKIMTIREAQQLVDRWINTTGVRYFNELTNMAMLTEEVGEVARIMARRYGEQSFKETDKAADLADEMADVLFVLICLANQTGIDLDEALRKNLEKKEKRDKQRHKNNPKLR